ncbi:MAG: glycosyltransferase [Brevinemataceae bacterium]
MKKLHILITYTTTGLGHQVTALAIANRLKELYSDRFEITTCNFFTDAGEPEFTKYLEEVLNHMLKIPWAAQLMLIPCYLFLPFVHLYMRVFHRKVWLQSIKYIKEVNPDVVVTTHFFTQTVAIDAKKQYNLSYPVITFNPDIFDVFPCWDQRGDLFLVCSDKAEKKARFLGFKEQKLQLVAPALRQEFELSDFPPKSELQKNYHLNPELFTVFMSDGGQGRGKMQHTLHELVNLNIPMNIITVCGKNEELYEYLSKFSERLKQQDHVVNVVVFGFVESIVPILSVSDLFVGKSGPSTVFECLKMGCPVIVNLIANPAEKQAAYFFRKHEVLWICQNSKKVAKMVGNFVKNPELLNDTRTHLNQMELFHDGATMVADIILKQIS